MHPHVVIRHERYVAGTRDHPEVGIFTQTHTARPPVPWGKIDAGDLVWMKWSGAGGQIVAQARVQRYLQIENCGVDQLRQHTFGYRLHELDDYGEDVAKKGQFFAVLVYLEGERWLVSVAGRE